MQINNLQSANSIQQIARNANARPVEQMQPTAQTANAMPVDQLELSAEAQQMMATSGTQGIDGGIRADRVATLREAIANGSYETPEKLSVALDRLLDSFA